MKKFLLISLLSLLLALPSLGVAQSSFGHPPVSLSMGSAFASGNAISPAVVQVILTQAAPYFGFAPIDFVHEYETCGCITIEQVGPNAYYVTYGGLGITIIIDGSRTQGPNTGLQPGTKR